MSKAAVARRYAQAACDLAEEKGILDEFVNQLEEVVEAFETEGVRERLFSNPAVSEERKRDVLRDALGDRDDNLIASLFHLILDKDRFEVLPALVEAFHEEADRRQNRSEVKLETAHPLNDEQSKRLSDSLESALQRSVRLAESVDEELIAGLRMHVDDYRIDYSVQNQLERFRRRFT